MSSSRRSRNTPAWLWFSL